MSELCAILEDLLPPGVAPPAPTAADFQHYGAAGAGAGVLSSPRSPGIAAAAEAGLRSPESPPQKLSLQEQLNQINRTGGKQPGSYPHGKGRGLKQSAFLH